MEYLFMLIAFIISAFWSTASNGSEYPPVVFFFCSIAGLFFERKLRMKYRCIKCKKNWTLKKISTRLDSTEDITVLKEVKNRNRNGDVVGTSEQYVPAKRYHYLDRYKCKACGEITERYHSEDSV